jgi:hypothetical protein
MKYDTIGIFTETDIDDLASEAIGKVVSRDTASFGASVQVPLTPLAGPWMQ